MCLSVTFNESSTLNTEINGTDVIFKKDILFLIKNLKTRFLNKHNIYSFFFSHFHFFHLNYSRTLSVALFNVSIFDFTVGFYTSSNSN